MHHRLKIDTDIVVAGGGMAGVCAALAAARCGARVILCQDRPVLGGNASSEIRVHICGAAGFRGTALETEAREGGIIEEIRLDCAASNPLSSPAMFDLLLYDKCIRNKNIQLLLNTCIDGVVKKDCRIVSVHATRSSTEDDLEITGKLFIDCTGDGRLGAEAGAVYTTSREAACEYGESLALTTQDHYRLGSSILFKAVDTGKPISFSAPPWARKFTAADLHDREIYGYQSGYWWIEYGGMMDTIKENELIRHELVRIVLGVWDYIKNSGEHPQATTHALEWIGSIPGKRQSRRFIGHHVLTQNDIEKNVAFDDAIAYGGWPFDTHPPAGIDAQEQPSCEQPLMPNLYQIPLSCCVSKNTNNLLFAGRNISASYVAFTSTRVMATCAVIGQAVGTFAAIASKADVTACQALYDSKAVKKVQQMLLQQDAYIPGMVRDTAEDLSHLASVSASSEQPAGQAQNILNGHTRSTHGPGGAKAGHTITGTHRWMSDTEDETPWIQLAWDGAADIGEIEIIFDTGMHRRLALTQEPQFREIMIWGPQPETVKDFRILSDVGQGFQRIIEVKNNYQRCYKVRARLKHVKRLRVQIDSTHGIDHARIFEIRCHPLCNSEL